MNYLVIVVGIAMAAVLAACGSGTASPTSSTGADDSKRLSLQVTSTAFAEGGDIPRKYSCLGDKISPELKWTGAPAATKSFVLVVQDPDAPSGTFIHWVAYDIPPSQTEIPEGAQTAGISGKNSARQDGYTAPCPPSGTHRYIFNLYALDVPSLGLQPGATRDQVVSAMQGHILAQATLTGRYSKSA